MPRRTPLRSDLPAAFRVADALASGHSPSRLRGGDLERPFRGVRTREHAGATPHTYAPLLRPGDRFSGVTALALWGAPLPLREFPLHVTATGGRPRPRRRGIAGHEGEFADSDTRLGLPVSAPAVAFLEAASDLRLGDLVAVGDYLVLDPRVLDPRDIRPHIRLDELRGALAAHSGNHVRAARRAAALVREGVESRPETLLRLLIVDAGLPEPECGVEVRDRAGKRIGWFDLVWPERRVIAEYDGDQHRTSTHQYDRDIRRFDRATDAGYRVIRVRSRGLGADSAETLARIRTALSEIPSPIRQFRPEMHAGMGRK